MAIIDQPIFRPCVDDEDPDDYRPESSWAVAADPDASHEPFVEKSVVIFDRVAPGDRVPLHTHPIDEVVVVQGGPAVLQLGDETQAVQAGAVMFIPKGVPHAGTATDAEVTFIGFFAEPLVEITYLERNPAPGTEGQPPQPSGTFDVRAEASSRARLDE